ncbi:MAG: hypothetical protein Q7V01_12865 [Vicinamibacterales bacterium]|nr:hypothetical protein [Vicinamibacterales bacterium]
MEIDDTGWTGDGAFTPVLLAAFKGIDGIVGLRVEDAPASRTDAGYALIANEIFVTFRTVPRHEPVKRLGFLPGTRTVAAKAMTLEALAAALAAVDGVGEPDYADEGMLQYLRTERITAPYQTKGVKVVEMIRVYEAGR